MTPTPAQLERLKFFFDAPRAPVERHSAKGQCSVLYLLRRELIETMGYDPNVDEEASAVSSGARRRLFASTILSFTVCDLLAKFMLGEAGQVGERFKRFLQSSDGCGMPPDDAELLWAIRNSLVHSFSVPPADKLLKLGLTAVALAQSHQGSMAGVGFQSITERKGELGVAYVNGIVQMTNHSIHRYQDTLYGEGSDEARARFDDIFHKYGSLRMAVA